jgi:hypothetical protein
MTIVEKTNLEIDERLARHAYQSIIKQIAEIQKRLLYEMTSRGIFGNRALPYYADRGIIGYSAFTRLKQDHDSGQMERKFREDMARLDELYDTADLLEAAFSQADHEWAKGLVANLKSHKK